jgi:hypothetical protein
MKGLFLISILLLSGGGARTDAPRQTPAPEGVAETKATAQEVLPILRKLADAYKLEVRSESVRNDRVSWHVVVPTVAAFYDFWKEANTNLAAHGWQAYILKTDYIDIKESKHDLEFRPIKNK